MRKKFSVVIVVHSFSGPSVGYEEVESLEFPEYRLGNFGVPSLLARNLSVEFGISYFLARSFY